MTSAGPPPINDELEARQLYFDVQVSHESALKSASAPTGSNAGNLESLEGIDQTTATPNVASAGSDQFKIDPKDRVLVLAAPRHGPALHVGLILGALIAASGLAWIVMSTLPFGSARMGGSNGHRSVDTNMAPSNLAEAPESKRGDRLQGRTAEILDTSKLALLSASTAGYEHRSLGAAASGQVSAKPQRTSSMGPKAVDVQTAKLAAVPETRPTTIEGWTLREVVDGTAVLEGPNGIRKARRGDTVPGIGRIESMVRWGSRWIVATTRGLVSTP
jgi:hypothetical protein